MAGSSGGPAASRGVTRATAGTAPSGSSRGGNASVKKPTQRARSRRDVYTPPIEASAPYGSTGSRTYAVVPPQVAVGEPGWRHLVLLERRGRHPERLEQSGPDDVLVLGAGGAADDPAEDAVARGSNTRSGRRPSTPGRGPARRSSANRSRSRPCCRSPQGSSVGKPARHREQVTDRDRRGVGRRSAQAGEVGDVPGDRVVQAEQAVIAQRQDRGRGEALRHRRDPEHAVGVGRRVLPDRGSSRSPGRGAARRAGRPRRRRPGCGGPRGTGRPPHRAAANGPGRMGSAEVVMTAESSETATGPAGSASRPADQLAPDPNGAGPTVGRRTWWRGSLQARSGTSDRSAAPAKTW